MSSVRDSMTSAHDSMSSVHDSMPSIGTSLGDRRCFDAFRGDLESPTRRFVTAAPCIASVVLPSQSRDLNLECVGTATVSRNRCFLGAWRRNEPSERDLEACRHDHVSGDRADVSCDRAIQASHHCLMPAAPSKLTRYSASRSPPRTYGRCIPPHELQQRLDVSRPRFGVTWRRLGLTKPRHANAQRC